MVHFYEHNLVSGGHCCIFLTLNKFICSPLSWLSSPITSVDEQRKSRYLQLHSVLSIVQIRIFSGRYLSKSISKLRIKTILRYYVRRNSKYSQASEANTNFGRKAKKKGGGVRTVVIRTQRGLSSFIFSLFGKCPFTSWYVSTSAMMLVSLLSVSSSTSTTLYNSWLCWLLYHVCGELILWAVYSNPMLKTLKGNFSRITPNHQWKWNIRCLSCDFGGGAPESILEVKSFTVFFGSSNQVQSSKCQIIGSYDSESSSNTK